MPLRLDRVERLIVAAGSLAQALAVAAVAATEPTGGTASVVAAFLLAPVAVTGVALTAARFRRGAFPAAAVALYVLLPFLGNRYLLAPERAAYDRQALPALFGLQQTGVFALGVAAIVLAALLPERLAAAAGLVGVVAAFVVWSPGALGDVPPMLHENAWSVAFAEWLVVASIVAVVLRRPLAGTAVGAVAAVVILRAAHQAQADAGFWRALGPLVPAGGVLVASLWLLVPRLGLARLRRAAAP